MMEKIFKLGGEWMPPADNASVLQMVQWLSSGWGAMGGGGTKLMGNFTGNIVSQRGGGGL